MRVRGPGHGNGVIRWRYRYAYKDPLHQFLRHVKGQRFRVQLVSASLSVLENHAHVWRPGSSSIRSAFPM